METVYRLQDNLKGAKRQQEQDRQVTQAFGELVQESALPG